VIGLTATPVPGKEAQEIMLADAATLLSKDILCPLARKITEALALLERAIEAHKPE